MSHVETGKEHAEFSPTLFVLINISLSIAIGFILWLALPASVFLVQWKTSLWKFIVVFLSMSMFNCFLEYVFHRYVLHKPAVRFLSRFYKSHTKHHALTHIGKRRLPSGREIPYVIEVVSNNFPMTKPEQRESAFFPWYSLIVFYVVITPVIIPLQIIMPTMPWLSVGGLAILSSLTLYEFVHAVEHWDPERLDYFLEHPKFGDFFRKAYSFHLRHHAVIDCNESISGFFTLPIADWVFGTFILPETLYVDGGEWNKKDFIRPVPCKSIAWLDKLADEIVLKHRQEEVKV
jgi:hemolysin III